MAEAARQQLEGIARRWIEEGWQRGRVAMVDELHSPDFVDHDAAGRAPDRAGFKQGIADLYDGFPDLYTEIEDLVVDPDRSSVAVRWSATGTHRGSFMGLPPTGNRVSFKGIEIIRIRGGRIVERWGEWDGIDLLQQLAQPAS
jgi:steroid delta-isomerase-like uncharacterized protein